MNFRELIGRNISFYKRYYRLISVAVLIMVTILVGSLMVGDSVRSSLVKKVNERLGDTESVIFSKNSFFEYSVLDHAIWDNKAQGVLLSNGFVSDNGRLIPVTVWGVDNKDIPVGELKLNPLLAEELDLKEGEDIVLRLPATGLVPSGSLFVTKNYTTGARFAFGGVIDIEEGGNISLKNEQATPYNIFVRRTELATTLNIEGKINIILTDKHITEDEFNSVWSPSISGIELIQEDGFAELKSDRVFIQPKVVEKVCADNPQSYRLFSYMTNSLELGKNSIPYSFITATDQYKGYKLGKDEVILSDYSAGRLGAKINDSILLVYYTSHDLKTLKTDSLYAKVSAIVPLAELLADKSLSAEFPGLTDVEKCTEWDSDLPINMDLIDKEDEDYWTKYRSTPKALVSYNAVGAAWSNSYGSATAIRIHAETLDTKGITASMFDIQIIYPKEAGLASAVSGVDFSSLFLSLGFYIIISAILLMLIPLTEMIYRRKNEINLLKSLGFTHKRITKMLWQESVPIVLTGTCIGAVIGILYTWITLYLLESVWKGATHTDAFILFFSGKAIVIGLLVGFAVSLFLLHITIRQSLKNKKRKVNKNSTKNYSQLTLAILSTLILLGILVINIGGRATYTFSLLGLVLMLTVALWLNYMVSINANSSKPMEFKKIKWANLLANRKRILLSFFTLTIGVFMVFSVGFNRRGFTDSSQLKTETGGYSLWCETSVPIYHNLNTDEGRKKLNLNTLPDSTQIMQLLRYGADDASCLNLNRVSQPTVLGVDINQLENSDFEIESSIYEDNINTFDILGQKSDSTYPVLVDATVLMWGLMMNLGDTIVYENEGKRINLKIAGILKNSVFQGNLLMDKNLFKELWPEIGGSEVMLIKVNGTKIEETKNIVSQTLYDYGLRVYTTNEKLEQFYSVTNTYLNIFLVLGGLGLLLGVVSFVVVVRKDLASRTEQIKLYKSLGFNNNRIASCLVSENTIVPLMAILSGALASLIAGVGSGLNNIGIGVWILSSILLLSMVVVLVVFIKISVKICLLQK